MNWKHLLTDLFVVIPAEDKIAVRDNVTQLNMSRMRSIALITLAVESILFARSILRMINAGPQPRLMVYMSMYALMMIAMVVTLWLTHTYNKTLPGSLTWAHTLPALGCIVAISWGAVISLADVMGAYQQVMVYVAMQYLMMALFVLKPLVSLPLLALIQLCFALMLGVVLQDKPHLFNGHVINTSINTALCWLVSRLQYMGAYRQFQASRTIQMKSEELVRLNVELEHLSVTDPLTVLMNRRRFDEVAEQEWRRACRDNLPMTIAIADVDNFKQYNDIYGHQMGDVCLRHVADSFRDSLRRASDIVARFGGEEFVILLVGDEPWQARATLQKVCSAIEEMQLPHRGAEAAKVVTISMGGYCVVPRPDIPFQTMLHRADDALYHAKNHGRNRFAWEEGAKEGTQEGKSGDGFSQRRSADGQSEEEVV